ncbi:uncharacterized protein CEXT_380011 [Caerostris extrusa]|uniref:Uncharacterized protein n=1 Tax=Caerostris extrusa TaxID=172846 RepID=A0AAV4N0U3_CAEEX|nr:uncharacterized protein CEXT_380011 [Caerostris extrusa]
MRRQRFAITLPTTSETDLPTDQDDTTSTLFSKQFQSVSSVLNSASFAINPYESFTYFGDGPLDSCGDFTTSSPISDSGYGDCLVPEVYPFQEFPCDGFQTLQQEVPDTYPMVTNYGAVTILLRHLIRVDISPEKAVFVTNSPSECVAVACGSGDKSGVIHPNGRVLHEGDDIHMTTLNRKAKISKRGIVFTSADHCLSYLVDASGTKTTAEKFRDLSHDFTQQVFYSDNMSCESMDACCKLVEEAVHKHYKNGDEVWIVGGFRIKQDQWETSKSPGTMAGGSSGCLPPTARSPSRRIPWRLQLDDTPTAIL